MATGYTCFNAHSRGHAHVGCGNHIEFPDLDPNDWRESEKRAGEAGWCIGHLDGQGQIACPECASTLWDAYNLKTGEPLATGDQHG